MGLLIFNNAKRPDTGYGLEGLGGWVKPSIPVYDTGGSRSERKFSRDRGVACYPLKGSPCSRLCLSAFFWLGFFVLVLALDSVGGDLELWWCGFDGCVGSALKSSLGVSL